MRKKQEPTKFVSADQFRDPKHAWIYRFPIKQVLDPRFGRIEVELEPVVKRCVIRALRIQFVQHEIEELKGLFEIPQPQADKSTMLTTCIMEKRGSFFSGVWSMGVCSEHHQPILRSYAPNGATALVIECLNAVIGIRFDLSGG